MADTSKPAHTETAVTSGSKEAQLDAIQKEIEKLIDQREKLKAGK